MNKKISAAAFREALDRRLSGLTADPFLAQRIIALEKGETKMKKKLSVCIACVLAVLMLTAAGCAVASFYRVVTWQGEISRTAESPQTPDAAAFGPADQPERDRALASFLEAVPDEETAFAWFEGGEGEIISSVLHQTQKTFSGAEAFAQALSGAGQLTLPQWLPQEAVRSCSATVYMDCKAFGRYDLLKKGQSGPIRYTRFRLDDASALATGYSLILTLEDGRVFFIRSELREASSEEPLMLREGETAKKVAVKGMSDALWITAEDPAYPDGLIMQRKLRDPVRLKQLPLHDKLEESDDKSCLYEYVTVWVYHQDDPSVLFRLFPAG